MAMKGFSTFPKSPGLELNHQIIRSYMQDIRWGDLTSSLEMQSKYTTAPVDWADEIEAVDH